jgi:hypothetical protein
LWWCPPHNTILISPVSEKLILIDSGAVISLVNAQKNSSELPGACKRAKKIPEPRGPGI